MALKRAPRASDALPLEFTPVDERRRKVAQLLTWGVSQREIARTVGVDEKQVRLDIAVLRQQLAAEAMVNLGDRIRRSVANRKMVQFEAMSLFHRLIDTMAREKVAALSTYLLAQDAIDKLEGTSAPDAQHGAAVAEAFEVMMASLERVGGKAQVQAFLEDLQRSHRAGTSGLLLGARDADEEEQEAETVVDSESADGTFAVDEAAGARMDEANGNDDEVADDDD